MEEDEDEINEESEEEEKSKEDKIVEDKGKEKESEVEDKGQKEVADELISQLVLDARALNNLFQELITVKSPFSPGYKTSLQIAAPKNSPLWFLFFLTFISHLLSLSFLIGT
ncbi:hypothetical protein FACS189472_16150 [Alphaproteobacteria bacterium]|nr:hypothetical protein FACS189472_16150 [Alphaproteobacteria bacterium]